MKTELATTYFSKEFPPDWEVEWKANLATQDPSGFINAAYDMAFGGELIPFVLPVSMGTRPLNVRGLDLHFHYFGHKDESGWHEDFVLAKPPGSPIYVPRIKTDVTTPLLNNDEYGIKIRKEKKGGLESRFPEAKLPDFIRRFQYERNIRTTFLGVLRRERYSFYLSNTDTRRNWSLVSDRCTSVEPASGLQMSQIEIEYKGRDGLTMPDIHHQRQALQEMVALGEVIQTNFGKEIIQPTTQTKFSWLLELQGIKQ